MSTIVHRTNAFRVTLVCLLVAAFTVAVVPDSDAAAAPICHGKTATIWGDGGNDICRAPQGTT